jgi:hypothetical protein
MLKKGIAAGQDHISMAFSNVMACQNIVHLLTSFVTFLCEAQGLHRLAERVNGRKTPAISTLDRNWRCLGGNDRWQDRGLMQRLKEHTSAGTGPIWGLGHWSKDRSGSFDCAKVYVEKSSMFYAGFETLL